MKPATAKAKRRGHDAERRQSPGYRPTRGWPRRRTPPRRTAAPTTAATFTTAAATSSGNANRSKTIDLPGFLRELAREKTNARVTTGAVVVKRRGSADPADWYAVLELSDFTELLNEAGYGDSISTPKQKEESQ